jgi:uncharacterized protein
MITDPLFYFVAFFAVGFYGLSKGGFNGAGLVSMPLLTLVISPLEAAAIMLPLLLAQDANSIRSFWKIWDITALKLLIPAGLAGILLGALLVKYVDTRFIKLAIGVISVVFCLHYWFSMKRTDSLPHSRAKAYLWGGISGFTSFFIHSGGTPYNIYLLPRVNDKILFAGTTSIFFASINLAKIPFYLSLGTLTLDALKTAAVLIPWAILSNMAGVWLIRRISPEKFKSIIYLLTFLVGLKLLYDSLF